MFSRGRGAGVRGRGVAGEVRCPGVVDDTFGRVVGTSHTINIHAVQEWGSPDYFAYDEL